MSLSSKIRQGDVLGDHLDGRCLGNDHGDQIPISENGTCLGWSSIQGYVTVTDQILDASTGKFGKSVGNMLIESGAKIICFGKIPFHLLKSIFELI